ncbi:MAG TPA: ABC transporter substrate-binding protein [Streptosporangiaceae bacterium]|nr:ABC transporter substrate-binding protein [Streptosporangiaceae bacterium]
MSREFLRVVSVAAAALSVLMAAGCTSSGTSTTSSPSLTPVAGLEKTNLTVGAVPVADEAGLYIAQDEGLFAQEGLHVTIQSIVSSADATKGQNNGTFDITAGNSVSYIQDQVGHQSDLEIVAEGSLMQADNQALYTLPESRITTISDLKGARIGVNARNNIGTLLISSVLAEYGVPASKVHFVPVNFPFMGQALQKGTIDVAWLPEPFGSADAESMGLRELCDLNQGATENFPVGWYVATKAWAKKYPRTLQAFLAALQAGQQLADSRRNIVEQAMERLPAPYTVPPEIAAVMTLETYPLSVAPRIDVKRVQRVANEMFQFHMLTQPFKVSTMLGGL